MSEVSPESGGDYWLEAKERPGSRKWSQGLLRFPAKRHFLVIALESPDTTNNSTARVPLQGKDKQCQPFPPSHPTLCSPGLGPSIQLEPGCWVRLATSDATVQRPRALLRGFIDKKALLLEM